MYRNLVRGVTLTKSNPDLEPEETETIEAATGYRFANGSLEIAYHHSDIENLIEAVSGVPTESDRINQYFKRFAGVDNLLQDIGNPVAARSDPYLRTFYAGMTIDL